MPNPLTGDFEAVLQVSGGTINRLLAGMHQNAFENPNLPSFPHSVRMRIGDDKAFEGVRGLVHAQVSVPRVELIHGATDHFTLEVGVRAWYRPDPGTEPLPAFIHGIVRAEYRMDDIDPACLGWSKKAPDFLWIRVVRDSVRFQGTVEEDKSIFEFAATVSDSDPAATAAANVSKITRQIARLLAKRFEATPHPVSKRFRRGSLRSLNAPIGGSALALPLGMTGEPVGQVSSINNVLLEGRDFGVAISREYILSKVQPILADVKQNFGLTISFSYKYNVDVGIFDVDVITVNIKWRVTLTAATADWSGGWIPLLNMFAGVITIKVSGQASTQKSEFNITFDATQLVTVTFDASTERFGVAAAGPPTVNVQPKEFEAYAKSEIENQIKPQVQAAVNQLVNQLDLSARKGDLINQLRTIDTAADARFDEAVFGPHGVIVRGRIFLAPRRQPAIVFEKTAAEDGHTAIESWIPGGRIDRFEWSWTWSGSGDPGTASYDDRFLLRRPWGKKSRWGMAADLEMPLPGLDGGGTVCLRITGVRVDPVTGLFVTVTSVKKCRRFGIILSERIGKDGRLFLRDMPELSQDVPFPQLEELPLVAARRGLDTAGTANTLLICVDEAWDGETASTLGEALEACRRYDAGLGVLVLFREGALEAGGPQLMAGIETHMRRLGVAAQVNEDVNGEWSRALELRGGSGEPGWAIISPDGAALWAHQGRISAPDLATALDTHLRRCRDLRPVEFRTAVAVGMQVTAKGLYSDLLDLLESPCPPLPLGHRGFGETVVTFVQKHSAASAIHLRKLAGQYGQLADGEGPVVVAVCDGSDPREAEALKSELGLDFVVVPDPTGKITDQFGIGVWPTTIKLDRSGIVSEVKIGMAARRDRESVRREDDDRQGDVAE
ncbi:MAG: TlpA disulfide reductase family protein [Desulfobacterales bacterium]